MIVAGLDYAIKRIICNDRGQLTSESYFDGNDKPIIGAYNKVHKATYVYDARDNIIEYKYWDIDGSAMNDCYGRHFIKLDFNLVNREIRGTVFDADGKPVKDNFHIIETDYDRFGNKSEKRYFGADKKLTSSTGGYAIIRWNRRIDGKPLQESYYDTNGNPVLSSEEIHGVNYSYDRFGNEIKRTYFGKDKQPVAIEDYKYASYTKKRDELGRIIEYTYWGPDNLPTTDEDGIYIQRYKYNDLGRIIEVSNHGQYGEPILSIEKWHLEKWKYDQRGNPIEYSYYGIKGEPISALRIYKSGTQEKDPHKTINTYDQFNQLTDKKFYNENGRPVEIHGFHHYHNVYDEFGNQIERYYYGVDGKFTLNKWGFARWEHDYDSYGRKIEGRLFGTNGKLRNSTYGYARYVYRYNIFNKRVEEVYYDANGNLTFYNEGGYARIEREYDGSGKLIEERKFDQHNTLIRQ
jgi:YD repeat-containing protein